MVLRLAGDLPLLWRTPSSVQFGSDPAVVILDDVSEGEDRLLAALAVGVSPTGYDMLARSLGVAEDRARALLDAVRPVLVDAVATPRGRVAVLGDSSLARAVAGLLAAERVLGEPDAAAVVVLVADGVLAPADHTRWLNRDVPHLPVVVGDRAVTVGPLVEPGLGPCLYCVHLTRTDDDPAWPAVATQLLGRAPRAVGPLQVAELASFVARRVLARLDAGPGAARSWRLDAGGEISSRDWRRHPDCRCAAPAGTDWAAAPDRARHAAPRSASAVGAPA